MKNKLMFLVSMYAVFSLATVAGAGTSTNETDPGSTLDLTDGATTDPATLALNFSPSVAGQYTTEGATDNEQWYSIGTYHAGGSLVYATSSQQTSIWKASRETNETFTDSAIPATEDNSNSESQWTTAGFEK